MTINKYWMTFKTALVTGGGRGIGAAISKMLAARGANVIVNYLSNKESAERIVSEIKAEKIRQAYTR
jgi:3-oxoacyl-[acyl-carrier protein] reductase